MISHRNRRSFRRNAFLAVIFAASVQSSCAQSVLDDWSDVKAPPPPAAIAATTDAATTALLILDIISPTCLPQNRVRCARSVPHIKALLDAARNKGAAVVYTLPGGLGPDRIIPDLKPAAGETIIDRAGGPDKFIDSDLKSILDSKGIKTVIVVGTSAQGAALYTASGAAMRGYKVLAAIDGMTANDAYGEQLTAWTLANAPTISKKITLTTTDKVTIR